RIDAAMADSVAMSDGFLKTENGEGFAFFGGDYDVPEYHGEGVGIGVRKEDTALKEEFNAAIDAIRASGKYEEIQNEYFDFNVYGS
ncbi:MAG: transporter substrate-binding domain-containing protein, partial [Pseudomonadota bacterium]